MSDQSGNDGGTPNRAQAEFDRYKARLGAAGPQGPVMLSWGVPPGWAPPGPGTNYQMPVDPTAIAQAGAGMLGRLAETVRLGLDFLNAALGSGAAALGSAGGWAQGYGSGGCGCSGCGSAGCSGDCGCSCGPSCCDAMCAPSCCTPSVHGCC